MGIAVSSWPLASAVSRRGQLGVVSSSGLDAVLARRLQMGDLGGHLRHAFDHFPIKEMADRIWARYFIEGGKSPLAAFKSKPLPAIRPSQALLELIILANYVEVFLAKRGHNGLVGINLLEKIQLPTLPSLYGAMLAKVDYVLMGAGIPRAIPAILDQLSQLKPVELPLDVVGADQTYFTKFEPKEFCPAGTTELPRPEFLAIVSSSALALTLARKCTGKVNGFVVEGKTAGGHNAPPRGALVLDEAGEPVYGPRDNPDLGQFREIGLPFWLAGSFGNSLKLHEAVETGAQGIQVGTAFAFCNESGLDPAIKSRTLHQSLEHRARVFTDPLASPTGFPFKVLQSEGTLSEESVYEDRERICDLGYLRELYQKEDGKVGYRCPAEPLDDYISKGGDPAKAVGRKCVCNGLFATIGLGQVRKEIPEAALVTAGDDVQNIAQFLKPGQDSYSADDVIDSLLPAASPDEPPTLAV
ncbi:MAG: nitronate monooxygenase [Fimbriimonadaceae bacterium]|nr:nitronate monooxygenase [Fimbriimonadaceae bacterium]